MNTRLALRLAGLALAVASSALAAPSAWAIVRGFRPSVRQYPVAERIVSVVELGARCTGVLLDERIVLTAAHCDTSSAPMSEGMAPHTTRELKRLGSGYTVFGQGFDPVRAVDAVILKSHWLSPPDRDERLRRELGDVMLLFLETPVQLGQRSRITVPRKVPTGSALIAFGLGLNDGDDGRMRAFAFGRSAGLGLGGEAGIDGLELEAPKGGALCEGDSGGPLFAVSANGSWELAGIYSAMKIHTTVRENVFGKALPPPLELCEKRARKFFFTSTAWHRGWIERAIRELYRRNGLGDGLGAT